MILSEHDEQTLLIKWFDIQYKNKFVLFSIPNGGQRNLLVAKKMKAEGVRAGVPDLFLAVPNKDYAGLFIEMKKEKGGVVSEYQKIMLSRLEQAGYKCSVCKGFEKAKKEIEEYLNKTHRKAD